MTEIVKKLSLLPNRELTDEWPADLRPSPRRQYHADMSIQERLFLEHIRLVYGIARRLLRAHEGRGALVDFLRAGMIGLQQATETYDSAANTTFAHHATSYIRRAIMYDLCSHEQATTSVRSTARKLRDAEEELAQCLGRRPEDSEIAWCLDIDVETLTQWRQEVERARLTSLRRAMSDIDGVIASFNDVVPELQSEGGLGNDVGGMASEHPGSRHSAGSILRHEGDVVGLRQAFLKLKEQERLVLSLLYYEGLSATDAASMLDMSVPLVLQLRAKGLRALRRSWPRSSAIGVLGTTA